MDEKDYVVCGCQASQGRLKIDITIWLLSVERPMRADAERGYSAPVQLEAACSRRGRCPIGQ